MRSHYNAKEGTLIRMARIKAFNPEQRRRVLREFMQQRGLNTYAWATEAGISEGTIRNFLKGGEHGSDSLSDRTYELLARAADVQVSDLRGEKPAAAAADDDDEKVAIRSFVGAGDEIISLGDDEPPIGYTAAPPGLDMVEATEVRGLSMLPLYRPGDLLFHHRMAIDPLELRDEVAVMQTKGRKRYVKLIQPGTKKGTFRLVSINPLYPPIEDQVLAWVAPIVWVRKKRWFKRR